MSTNDKVTCSGVSENTGVSEDSVACSDVKEKKCNRKVSFPLDDVIVTQYFEPSNPWQDVPSTTRAQLAAEYLEACRCHNTPAIDSVLQQIRELPENTIGGSMRAPRLALSDCSLLGTAPADALEALLRKVQFRRLELDHAEIDDEGAEALFDMVEYYESTAVLCLIGPRQFGIRGWQAASRMIKKSAELSEIEISESPLEANHAPVLARSLRPASCRLRSVCLQRAALAGDPLLCLVIALKTNNSVRELRLGDNRLSASDASQIANLLRYNTHLQLLDLSNNQIQDKGVEHIAGALVDQAAHSPPSPHQCPLSSYESRGLAFLVLWNNQLTRNCAGHLAKVLRASQSLCVLNVGRNALGSDAVRALQTDRIGGGPLVSLGLQAARLGPDAARAIADLIRNDTKLQRLDLRDNKLGAAGLQAILNAMKENTTLTQIDLDDPAETTTSVGVQSCTESATVARLLRDIRALCRRNEPAAPAPPDRLLRKISLTCHTAPAPKQSLPAEEERKVRLRSPAPSPAPSPAGSPVPAGQGHSRFSVIPVTSDRASVSTASTNTQAPRTTYSPTASRFKVVQVADPPQIQVQHTPRKTRFSVTRNYDTTYNPTLPPTTPSPSPSPSPSSSPAPDINLDYNTDNVNTDKSSDVHENKSIFDYSRDTNNTHTVKTDKSSNLTQNDPTFDYTTDNNKNKAKQEEEISIDLNSMLVTDAEFIVKTEQSKNDTKQGDLNKNDTKQMKNDIKNVTVSMNDSKSCEQIIKTEIRNDNIVIQLDNTAKSKDSNIMQLDSNTETKDNSDILDTVTKAKVIQDDRVIKQESTKNPTHDHAITDVKPKFIEETEPQYVVSKTVLLPKTENRAVLTQTEEIMNIPEFISNIQQEVKSENDIKTTKDEKVCEKDKNGGDWDSGADKNIDTIVIREDLKDKPEIIAKDLKESSKSVNMPESVISEPKFDTESISDLGPEITHVTEFYEKPEKLATILDSISKENESKDVISNIDVKVSDSSAKTVSSLNNEKLKATNVIGDCSDNLELINISDTNKFSESCEIERFGDRIEQMSHNETVDYVGDDKIVKTETKLVKSSIEASETDRVETEVSVTVKSENSLKTKVHRDQNVNKLVKEEKREVAIKQIEAITEDLGSIIQEMQDLSNKTIKKTATEDINVDIGVNNVPAVQDSVVLKKNRSESSLDSPDLEVSRLMRKPVSAFCDSSSSLEISGSSVESLNIERAKPIIIQEETRMSKESSVESTSEVTPVNLNVSISSNESVSPIIFGITKKIHGSLSSLEASMSSVDSARHEKVMVMSADSGIEYSLQNPSEIREDSSSNEGTLTCSSSLKESVKNESNETTSPKRTSSLLDVPALKSKGLERMRKISWVAPSASFHLPKPEEKVEYKLPTNLEKLLSLFQHPSSLFSRSNIDDEKKSTSSTPPRKDPSLTSSFWSWGSLTERADKDDADSLSEATDSTLSERVQVSFVDESFSRKLDSKTPSTDTDNTLSEFQTFPNSGESLPNSGGNDNSRQVIHNRGENLPNNGESAKVTELTTDDNLVQKSLVLRDNDACPDDPGACDIIDLITPNDLNRNVTQTSEKLDSGDRADTAACSGTLLKLEDEKVDVRPRTFASVLTSSSENSLEKQSSPEAGHPVDKLPSKVIRGIKENISPENTLTSSIATKSLAMELGERQTKNKTTVNAVWEVSMPCVEKSEPKTEEVKTPSVLAPIATIDETSDVAADDLIQLAYIDDPKVEERVVDIEKDMKTIEKLAVEKVDLGKDALSYLMNDIPNEDFEAETAHSLTEVKSPQGSLAQELRDAEIKELLDLSPELVIDDAVEIPEIFTVEITGRKSSPIIPERAKLKKSNSLEDLTKRPVEDKESPKLKTIAFKVPESTTPRDIPERRSKLRSRSGSSPKSLPESLNKPCPLTKMDSVISKKKKKASSLGKTARDSLLMLNMSEDEIAEFRRPYKLTSVESLRSLESVSEDANSQSGTSVDSRCRACLRTSQESLMSLDSITEDCRCMEECEKRHSNR
ncbi:serine-rich adhesin for platelets isoform X2 [Maniola hyperantus]|uniref:serine-rich adhesin for platelets isoform X2 n=1 Tax=Aphantopus hyperantus TaxID=2795564 RepID=UPI003747E1CB